MEKFQTTSQLRMRLLATFFLISALAGFISMTHLNTCTADISNHNITNISHHLVTGWRIFSGLLLCIGISLFIPRTPLFIQQNSGRNSFQGLFLLIFILFLIPALYSIFVVINIACATQLVWLFLLWGMMTAATAMLLYPAIASRILLVIFSLLFTFLMLEGGLRLYMRLNPINTLFLLYPDEQVGWKHPPLIEHEWAGTDPTCVQFRIPVKTGSTGFYDYEHELEKPENTIRIAVLGDSVVEAAQVDFDKRATQVLEAHLQHNQPPGNVNYEVLNFGVSNYSVGQYLLVYETYASQYSPDYVFVYLSPTQMIRTVSQFRVNANENEPKIRPTFALNEETGELIRIPPGQADLEQFEQQAQEWLDEDGQAIPRYVYTAPPLERGDSFLKDPFEWLSAYSQFTRFLEHRVRATWGNYTAEPRPDRPDLTDEELYYYIHSDNVEYLMLHNAILTELAAAARHDGAQVILVYNSHKRQARGALQQLARQYNLGFINLDDYATRQNRQTLGGFLCDSHFNTEGNQVFADAMYDWLLEPHRIYGTADISVYDTHRGEWQIYRVQDGAGIYMFSIFPDELSDESLRLEAEDGWFIQIVPQEDYYELQLYTPEGTLIDSHFHFTSKGAYWPE